MRLQTRLMALEQIRRKRFGGQCPACFGLTGLIITDQMDEDDEVIIANEAEPCAQCGWKPMQIVIVRIPDNGRDKPQDVDGSSE